MAESGEGAANRAWPKATAIYALGSSHSESARLERQADELAMTAPRCWTGSACGQGTARSTSAAARAGSLSYWPHGYRPGGRVAGLDADPVHTAMAAEFAAGRGMGGVEIMTADARRTGLPSGSFDLVHARTLLVNVPQPVEVVAEMARLAKPGGWVASMEPDTEYAMCYPPHPAFTRICEIFPVVFGRNGADHTIGRRVPELFRQAGLADVGVEARVQMYPPGNSRRTIRLDLVRSMRAQVLDMGLAGEAELDELDASARAHLDDPRTIAVFGLLFLAWARKPA